MLLLLFMLLEVGLHFTWHFVKTDYSVTISICRSYLKSSVGSCCAVRLFMLTAIVLTSFAQ